MRLGGMIVGLAGLGAVGVACGEGEAPAEAVTGPVGAEAYGLAELARREWGFEPAKQGDKRAQEAIDAVFRGDAFRLRIPVELFRSAASRGILDISAAAMWEWLGNPPSPHSRGRMGDPRQKAGLGLSVFSVPGSTTQFINFNCFSCHAGVVAGQLVAGAPNVHADQYAQTQGLYLFEDMSHVYKDLTEETPSWGLLRKVARAGQEARKDLVLSRIGDELGMNRREVDEALHHLRWFSLYSETILAPALGNASARGDNLGPFPVWKLMSRMKDPERSGFEIHDHFDPVELDRVVAHRLKAVRELRAAGSDGRPMGERLSEWAAAHPLPPGKATREDMLWQMPTVDTNPWWQRKYKTKSYWYLDSLATAAGGKDFAVNFHVPHDDANVTFAERAHVTGEVLYAAERMLSPPWPRLDDVDWGRVERGRAFYNRQCASCHGAVDPVEPARYDPADPRWVLRYRTATDEEGREQRLDCRIHDVGTDPAYSDVLKAVQPLALHLAGVYAYYEGERDRPGPGAAHRLPEDQVPVGQVPAEDGYMAPPLVGVWASAPYLHNGSVPTLRDLLGKEGADRPAFWSRSLLPAAYDHDDVGLAHTVLAEGELPAAPLALKDLLSVDPTFQTEAAVRHRNVYRTDGYGRGNRGHDYLVPTTTDCDGRPLPRGDAREEACLEQVLEFLRVFNDQRTVPDEKVHTDCPAALSPRQMAALARGDPAGAAAPPTGGDDVAAATPTAGADKKLRKAKGKKRKAKRAKRGARRGKKRGRR